MSEKRYSKPRKISFKEEKKVTYTLRACARKCMELDVSCPVSDCRHWIDYKKDNNCSLCAVDKSDCNGFTLRETAERLGISFVRVKQIEDAALRKIKTRKPQLFEYLVKDDF